MQVPGVVIAKRPTGGANGCWSFPSSRHAGNGGVVTPQTCSRRYGTGHQMGPGTVLKLRFLDVQLNPYPTT